MLGKDFCGSPPQAMSQSIDGSSICFSWRKDTQERSNFLLDLATLKLRKLAENEELPASYRESFLSPNQARAAYMRDNKIWLIELGTKEKKLLYGGKGGRTFLGFAEESKKLIYRSRSDLCTIEIESRLVLKFMSLADEYKQIFKLFQEALQ